MVDTSPVHPLGVFCHDFQVMPGVIVHARASMKVVAQIDLNADLGEIAGDLALMEVVTSANIACGAHAGDDATMAEAMRLAVRYGVSPGAHPSYEDRAGFGRVERNDPPEEVASAVAAQVERLAAHGTVSYVKLHGALYHRANNDPEMAAAILEVLPVRHVLAQPGCFVDEATARGLGVTLEGFCDRAYRRDGTLVPRGEPGAVLEEPDEVENQAVRLARSGGVGSLCLHGDTPGAVGLARRVRGALAREGIEVVGFA